MNVKTFLKIGLIALVLSMFGYCSKKKDDNKNQKGAIALLALSGSNNSSGNASAATPTFSPATGTFTSAQSVTITSTTSGATIRYTEDGTDPTCSTGTVYSTALSIATTKTIKAIACQTGLAASSVANATYTISIPPGVVVGPEFSPTAGTFTSAQNVTITSTTGSAEIRYTTDGTAPTCSTGTVYSAAISVSVTTTIKAIACKTGMTASSIDSALYTITYSIGGTIAGLTATGLVLQNNTADDLTIAANATAFTFATKVSGAYSVTVKTQPTGQTCNVTKGSGTASANVTDIVVSCGSDGSTWTARTLPSSANRYSVTYGNGTFVAVAGGPSTKAATSPDGITWTQRTLPSADWYSVTYGNGTFVAVANASTVAASSTDGITWTARTLPSSAKWYSVTYGNGTFVAVAGGPSTVAASSP